MATTTEKIKISLQADVTQTISQLNKVKSELKTIAQDSSIKVDLTDLNKLISDIDKYKKALKNSTAIGSDEILNTNQLKSFEKNLGTSLDSIINKTNKYYKEANKATQITNEQTKSLSRLEAPAKRGSTAIDKLGVSLTNSLRYNIVNDFVDNFLSKGGEVVDLLTEVDNKLTQIQIVSGKTSGAIQGVRQDALIGAKNLASTTEDVLSAYETYYQQGLSSNEAKSRAEATIMAANVSDQSVSTTAEQVTAVLNGFNISATNTVDVLGKMANIGAKTATDFSEIASAMQKVASASDVAGLSLDDTLAAMATISSVTREAPETIGTSLNAILGRIGNLKVDDEYTSAIEQIYDDTESGLTLFDKQTGLLKDASTILSELAEKWDILDINQKRAITSQLAGTRQANRLLALMENWDMFEEYKDYASSSENALEEQNDIYLQSVEAAQNRMETAWDTFWLNLFDEDALKGFYNFSADMIEMFDNATESAGGLLAIIRTITGLMSKTVGKQIGGYIGSSIQANALRKQVKTNESVEAFNTTQSNVNQALKNYGIADLKLLNEAERQINLTEEQKTQYANLSEELIKLTNETLEYEKVLKSPVFKDIKIGRYADGKKETEELTDARSFMNYASGVINPTISGTKQLFEEGGASSDLIKDILTNSKTDLNTVRKKYSDKGMVDESLVDEFYINLESLKNVLTQFSNTSDKVIQDILKTTKENIEVAENSQEELKQKYSDIYDNRKNGNVLKGSVQNIVNKQSSGETLNTKEQEIFNRVQLAQSEEAAKKKISLSLQNIIDGGFDLATLNLDGKVDEEQFFNALIKMIQDGFKRIQNENLDGGLSLSQQANIETKAQNNLNKNKNKLTSIRDQMSAIGKGADWNKWTQRIFFGAQIAGSAITGLTQIFDDNLNMQEKLSAGTNALGSALSAIPGLTGAIGFAVSTLGPILIETFGIGADKSKELQKEIENTIESFDSLTLHVKEQSSELSNISDDYKQLTDLYSSGKLDINNLTEAQQQQYDNVRTYVERYAPELIKYYNAEGEAVLDLSNKYNKISGEQGNYLNSKFEIAEQTTYARLLPEVSENANKVVQSAGLASQKIIELKNELQELNKKAISGADVADKIASTEEELSKYQEQLSSVSSNWNDIFTTVVTKANSSYYELNSSLQNSILATASYSNFLKTDIDTTTQVFEDRITRIINALEALSEEQNEIISNFDENTRNALFSFLSNIELTQTNVEGFLNLIKDEEDFISGKYISELMTATEMDSISSDREIEDYNERQELIGSEDRKEAGEKLTGDELHEQMETLHEQQEELQEAREGMVTGYADIEEQLDQYSEAITEVAEQENDYITSSTELYQNYVDTLVNLAETGPEAFNQIQEAYMKMYEALQDSSFEDVFADFGYSSAEEMQDAMGALYTSLNTDNEDFYNQWLAMNVETINRLANDLGIYASDYSTYSEYMNAVNEKLAQNKVLLEIMATEGAAAAQEKLNQFKEESALAELAQAGKKEDLLVYMSLKKDDKIIYNTNQATIKKLESYQAELEGFQMMAQQVVSTDGAEKEKLSQNIATYASQLNSLLAGVGITDVSLSGAASSKAFQKSIDAVNKEITNKINALKKKNQSILDNADTSESSEFEELAEFLTTSSKMPTFNYDFSAPQFTPVSSQKIPTSSKPNNVSKVGGGDKGDKDKKDKKDKEEKEVEDMELELDILRPYIIALEELEHQLDIISEKKEQVWGQQYVNYLNQELDLNKQILSTNEAKLKAAQDYANVLKQQLSAQGVKFTDYGAISNYNEILQSKVNAANAKTGDAKEAAQDAVKDFQDLMDKYEEYALDTVRDIEKEMLDVQNNIAELAQEKIEYYVEIIVETKDNKNDLVEFLADVQKYNKGEVNFSIELSNNADQLINSLNALQDIESKTSVDDLIKQVTESPELQGMTDKQLEIIQNRIEELQELGSELMEFEEAFAEAFADAFDEAMDLLDDQLSKYDNILNQYNYILDLAEKLGNNNDLNFNTQTYDKIIDIYKNNLEATKQLAEDIKASRDQFEVGTEDWQTANEKYLEAQSKVIDQEKELTDALENKFDSTVSIGRDQIENILFNGGTLEDAERELEKLNKLRDKYLDKEQKIYSLDKMKYQIMQDMDEYEYNPAAQKELEDWMNKELDYLNNKKDLTQDDLDLAEKQYAVMKARIDMENAYNNKKYTATLQRNADGTYGYMYIQDTSQYEAASQSYRDAIDDLYNYSLERNEALQQENIELKQEALEEYDRIVAQLKAGMITSEEATKLLQETFNQLQENLRQNAAEQEIISQNAVAATQLQILMNEMMNSESMSRIQEISTETQQIINDNLTAAGMDYDDFVNSKLYQELSREDMFTADVTEEWNKLDELINNDMDSIANDFNFDNEDSMISKVVNSINEAYKEFNDVVTEAFQNAIDREEELINSTNDLNKQTVDLNKKLQDEINKVTELKNKYNELRDNVTKALDEITNSLNKLANAQTNVQNAANKGSSSSSSSSSKGSGSNSKGSGSSSGGGSLKKGSSVKVKSGRRWYYDSQGRNPSGPTTPYANRTLYIVNTSSNSYPYALGTSKSIGSALGWVKKSDLVGYDTGGYTGDWYGNEGKLALLHKKEIILKEEDTKNFLQGIELSNELLKEKLQSYKIEGNKNNETVNYNEFKIDFPNATNHNEIQKAIEGLSAMATQYIGRKK